ncbi:MAG: lysophospholipid acyltransferase family protein [Deltaproteobacteria bacterium]|nr:lysophospholipid acyltransferase family protein [Deltaproteobacteria bacterium]
MAKSVLGSDPLARMKARSPKLIDEVAGERPGNEAPEAEGLPAEIFERAVDDRIATFERRIKAKLNRFDSEIEEEIGQARNLDPTLERRLGEALHRIEGRFQKLGSLVGELEEEERQGLLESIIAFGDAFERAFRLDTYRHYLNNFGMRDRNYDVDEFGVEVDAHASIQPLVEFLFHKWWRVEVEGIENIPDEGAALLVANHAGVLPYDGAMITYAVEHLHPARRRARFLAEDWSAEIPFATSLVTRLGGVRGSRENAERILRAGELVTVFPEGVKGSGKYYHERYRLQRFGRGGFVRMCLETGAAIIPVAVLGAEEAHPVLYKVNWLANLLRVPFFPVSPTFPLLGPLGLIPLPAKWTIVFGEPITLEKHGPTDGTNDFLVSQLKERVRNAIQQMLNERLAERRSTWLG